MGEEARLRKADIDFQAGFVNVEYTKSGHSRRIPLNAVLREALLEAVRQSGSEHVFGGENGRPVENIKKGWRSALRRAGIDLVTVAELDRHRTLKMT